MGRQDESFRKGGQSLILGIPYSREAAAFDTGNVGSSRLLLLDAEERLVGVAESGRKIKGMAGGLAL